MTLRKVRIIKVVDGDTVKVSIDLGQRVRRKDRDYGFHVYVEGERLVLHEVIRLYGINAPERRSAEGETARSHLAGLLPEGSEVLLDSIKPSGSQEKYGRWLGRIYLMPMTPGDRSVNDELVSLGYAKAWDGRGTRPV